MRGQQATRDRVRALVAVAVLTVAWWAAVAMWAHVSAKIEAIPREVSRLPAEMCQHRTVIFLEDGRQIVLAAAPRRCTEGPR